jgi:hypothetical protein
MFKCTKHGSTAGMSVSQKYFEFHSIGFVKLIRVFLTAQILVEWLGVVDEIALRIPVDPLPEERLGFGTWFAVQLKF